MDNMRRMMQPLRDWVRSLRLPHAIKEERYREAKCRDVQDPGPERAMDEGIRWLGQAQDCSASADGGVARHYSLVTGWGPSYPETTGYIVSTMLAYGRLRGDASVQERARRMLDWLVDIQQPCGGFLGGTVDAGTPGPVTFNTGQILLGFADGVRELGIYRDAMCAAADWLAQTQDSDGCWRRHDTTFAEPGEKVYETHVSWGLLEAARLEPDKPYAEAALANVRWAVQWQRDNGWLEKCCLTDPSRPLTHTIGYALRGIIEAYRFSRNTVFLEAARKTADGLLQAIRDDGFLAGRLHPDWRGAASWTCLTGSVQIALCWLILYQETGEVRYREAAYMANRFVRRTMRADGPAATRGGIKGSFPISGRYGTGQYLSWACKFFVDANMLEKSIRETE